MSDNAIDNSEADGAGEGVAREDLAFEDAMDKLEAVSAKLSGENVPLDEAISLYEEGIAYYGICKKKLDDVNRRIRVIEDGSKAEYGSKSNE